jgi:hypothetical protein
MRRTLVFAALTLVLMGCSPGGNQRSATIPQADTPPDPPAPASAVNASASSLPPSSSAAG